MILRLVTYHAKPDKDVQTWLQEVAAEVRGVEGMHHVDFVRSHDDPTQYGSIMKFRTKEDLDEYKASGPYERIVQNIRESWLDESKPIQEQIFDDLDI